MDWSVMAGGETRRWWGAPACVTHRTVEKSRSYWAMQMGMVLRNRSGCSSSRSIQRFILRMECMTLAALETCNHELVTDWTHYNYNQQFQEEENYWQSLTYLHILKFTISHCYSTSSKASPTFSTSFSVRWQCTPSCFSIGSTFISPPSFIYLSYTAPFVPLLCQRFGLC